MGHTTDTSSLTPVHSHREYVSNLPARTSIEQRELHECSGLALGEDITARMPLPPFDNSAMDGYAVRSVDLAEVTEDTPVTLPVAEDLPAGRTDVPDLEPGTAHRIMTGAHMPAGADATVPVERTDAGTERVRVYARMPPGANIRRSGEDVTIGRVVLNAGTSLTAGGLGLASAVGMARLPVHRPPTVLVLSTGSELVEPPTPLQPGQIYESNGPMLAAAVRECGGHASLLRFVPDDVEAFHQALRPYLSDTDLILTSGGVSAGAYEVVKDALADSGVRFDKVAIQPGMPQGAGYYTAGGGRTPVVALPGNPVSAMVSFEVFVRPALRRAGGHSVTERSRFRAELTEDLQSPPGKRQYRRGMFDTASGTVRAHGGAGSHLLSAMAEANCLLEIPEEADGINKGSIVDVWLLE